ncbi:MAG TPA: hypothetical protein VHI52_03805, partial [Verrucomicrobiae bacterium]|nr:hypothetical protein [Verrucomicrobiae bacterium]
MNRFERVNRHALLLRGWAATSLALALISTGCNGIPTKQETAARDRVHLVGGQYRPGGMPPVLPTLTPDSGLSNFLTYAMLKRPSIEAAYYDWAASVERITQARSFP